MAVSAPCRFLPVRWLAEERDALAGILIPAPLPAMREVADSFFENPCLRRMPRWLPAIA